MIGLLAVAFAAPPSVHLDRDPSTQWALSARPAVRALDDRWGGLHIRWDERNATPRFIGVSGVPDWQADALVDDIARLAGVDPQELAVADDIVHRDGRGVLRFDRRWRGVPVHGDEVAVMITAGRIGAIWVRLTPIGRLPSPRPGEQVLPVGPRAIPTLATASETKSHVTWRDRSGRIVLDYDPRSTASVAVTHHERGPYTPLVTDPARRVAVTDSTGVTAYTADDGTVDLAGDLVVSLTGSRLSITDAGASIAVSGVDDVTVTDPAPASDVLHHAHRVFDWLAVRQPDHAWTGVSVAATVNDSDPDFLYCNAWYVGRTIHFLPAYDGYCTDSGQVADVILHEIGHGVHDTGIEMGSFAGDVGEGTADYVAATILDAPDFGLDFVDGFMRPLDVPRRYPDDLVGEIHEDGRIWSSFLWDVRTALGPALADALFLRTIAQGPEMTDLGDAVLVADDDDGDWSNGTPNDCALIAMLDAHGIGPGAFGSVQVYSAVPDAAGSDETSYALGVRVEKAFETCTSGDADVVTFWTTTDAPLPGDDTTGWNELPVGDAVPRQPAGARVRVSFRVTASDGATRWSHGGTEDFVPSFWVGDRADVDCDNFDGDIGRWSRSYGLPNGPYTGTTTWAFGRTHGEAGDPDDAFSGKVLAGTALDATYLPDNQETLWSRKYNVARPGRQRRLAFRRWLSVEGAEFDQATLWLVGEPSEPLWTNGAGHTLLDGRWGLAEHDLAPALDPDGARFEPMAFAWSLMTDPGLEYGGWNLDDVCVTELADPERHYTAADLTAALAADGTVALSWTQPWVTPIFATALVRKQGAWPESIDDGIIIHLDLSPTPGEAVTVIDDKGGLEPGKWRYAVFAAGRDDVDWFTEADEGTNGAIVEIAEPEVPDTDVPDTDTAEPPRGCGCASAGSFTWAWVTLLVALRRRAAG